VRGTPALALAATWALGCSSSPESACADPTGTYELTVTATGQSEDNAEFCPSSTTASTVGVTLASGSASVNGEECHLTSNAGCEIEIACDGGTTEDGGAGASLPSYVQYAFFVLPTATGDPTTNALVEVGSGYCALEGTASLQP